MPTRLTLSNDLSNLISSANYNAAKIQLGLDSTASPTFSSISVTSGLSGNATTASTLKTGRTIGMTGDVTWTTPTFNGSSNVTAIGTLTSTGVISGTYGSLSSIPIFTVDNKGRLTQVTNSGSISATVAATANTLVTPRTINGISFNGSANITIPVVPVVQVVGTTNAVVSAGVTNIRLATALTSACTFTIPNPASYADGATLTFTDATLSLTNTNTATLSASVGTINGASIMILSTPGASPILVSNGTNRWSLDIRGITRGGTGSTTASGARVNLGLGPTDNLTFASLSAVNGNFTTISNSTSALTLVGGAAVSNLILSNVTSNLFQLGGTTSAFPAFKRSGSGVQVRVADDTADASFTAGVITGSSLNSTGGGNIAVANSFGWLNASRMNGGSDGNIAMWSTAAGQFAGLNFGSASNTSASPALRIGMNGTTFALRATNDTIDANLTCGNVTASGNLSAVNGTFSNSVSSKSISATSITVNGTPVAPSPVTYIFQYASNNAGVAVLSGVSTITPPTGWVTCMAEAIQGGAGGGSGRMGAVGTNRLGGTGGGGGNRTVRTIFSTNVPAGTWTITVGAGGAGGAGVPALSANTNGNPGSIGGASGIMRGSTPVMSAGTNAGGGSINNGNTGVGGTSAASIGGSISSVAGLGTYAGFNGYGVSASASGTSTVYNPNGATGGAGGGSIDTTETVRLSGIGYGGAANGGAANASGGGFAPAAIVTSNLLNCGIGGSGAGGGTNGGTDGEAGGNGSPGLVTLIFNF
jgi:hypothetical protein